MLKPAAFLDRDGVLNKDKGYIHKFSDFEWILDAKNAIKFLNKNNFYVIIVTNQSGISRGLFSDVEVNILHNLIKLDLRKYDAFIDDFFYSPYHPDFNNPKYKDLEHLRKPKTGMLDLAIKKWPIDKEKSFLIGDKNTDIECAKNFGIKGHLFKSGSLLNFIKSKENLY